MNGTVVSAASTVLAHTPSFAELGSKPSRVLPRKPELAERFAASLRDYDTVVDYAPHQAFIGRLHPRDLPARPWVGSAFDGAARTGPDGQIVDELQFYGLLAFCDDFDLLTLAPEVAEEAAKVLAADPVCQRLDGQHVLDTAGDVDAACAEPGAITLRLGPDRVAGAIRRAHDVDEALTATVLLENLAAKASGLLALLQLLADHDLDPDGIDYVLSCSEEAVGDRYQRGGGNLAKAIAAAAGLRNATGMDVKDFCAAPLPGLVVASSLVTAGVCRRVVVLAGGSLPKLGMKFEGHLKHELPVMEDVLAGGAALVQADDGASPKVRLDVVGRHTVATGSSTPQIMTALTVDPLERAGLAMTDVDDFATELHNPEITEPQGSGDVAARNYRTMAALAVRRGELTREQIDDFVQARGMPGYAPTQGHMASAICYLPHALRRLTDGDAQRVLLLAKGSLFLGRMSRDSDGMSVLLERNG